MLELAFFVLGIVNSLALTAIFLIRKVRLGIVQRFGWLYLLLVFPAGYEIGLALQQGNSGRYIIFLAIFITFLFFEWLLDYRLKIDFRTDIRNNLRWAVPYLALYYAMNYGFVVMPWEAHTIWGTIMLGLFLIQLAANFVSHPGQSI